MHCWRSEATSCLDIVYSKLHILILLKTNHFHMQRECHMSVCFLCASSWFFNNKNSA